MVPNRVNIASSLCPRRSHPDMHHSRQELTDSQEVLHTTYRTECKGLLQESIQCKGTRMLDISMHHFQKILVCKFRGIRCLKKNREFCLSSCQVRNSCKSRELLCIGYSFQCSLRKSRLFYRAIHRFHRPHQQC